tara:strand:+ start:97 stop:357 length:261 start_codon:yes stop_codon:yes gene_type:complete
MGDLKLYSDSLVGLEKQSRLPHNGNASETQIADKRLKIICGADTSDLADNEWIGEKTSLTFAEVRASPNSAVKPTVEAIELCPNRS